MEKLVAANTGFIVFLIGPFFSQCSCCYRRGIQFSLSLCFSRNILMQNPLWPEKTLKRSQQKSTFLQIYIVRH